MSDCMDSTVIICLELLLAAGSHTLLDPLVDTVSIYRISKGVDFAISIEA